nr:group II intron maturase-specific domain-containing protein [Paenibacillus planticolens]
MRKTSGKKFRAKVKEFKTWIRSNRHTSEVELMKTIRSKLVGHYNYYGVSDNIGGITSYLRAVERLVLKWRNRRSQKISFTEEKFAMFLARNPFPKPSITVNLFAKKSNSVR